MVLGNETGYSSKMNDFVNVLYYAWAPETAYIQDRNNWEESRPYIGQCTVTAMLVHDYFGGKIVRGKSEKYDIIHYWNIIDGERIDLTFKQFLPDKADIVFENIKIIDKSRLTRIKSVNVRYQILKKRYESLARRP